MPKKKKYSTGPHNAETAAHMRMRQVQNIVQSRNSKAETWAAEHLGTSGYKWTRQAVWGWRVFDFWSHKLGIAVEIDGQEHDPIYEQKRDARNWKVSRIRVIRVRNFNEDDMQTALEEIREAKTWNERREEAGLSLIRT